jgi:hypothetical protein
MIDSCRVDTTKIDQTFWAKTLANQYCLTNWYLILPADGTVTA